MKRNLHAVVFYTKAGCLLCDEARDILEDLGKEFLFTVQEIDIMSHPSLYHRYKDTIPVIVIDGKTVLEGRIREHDLRSHLK